MPRPIPVTMLTSERVTDIAGADVVAIPVRTGDDGPQAGPGGAEVAAAFGINPAAVLEREQGKGEVGEVIAVPLADRDTSTSVDEVLFVGVGDGDVTAHRRAGAALARRVKTRAHLATSVVDAAGAEEVRAFAEGLLLGSYSFSLRSGAPKQSAVRKVTLTARRAASREAALEGPGDRLRRLVGPRPGQHAVQREDPRLAGQPRQAHRPRNRSGRARLGRA